MKHFESVGLILLLGLTACQGSPLFNHAPAPGERRLLESTPEASECPIRFEKVGLCAAPSWVSLPTKVEGGVMRVLFWSQSEGAQDGPYVNLSEIPHVYLWMPAHGHGSSPVQVQAATDAQGEVVTGEFLVNDIFFIMPGNWDVHFQILENGSVVDEAMWRYAAT